MSKIDLGLALLDMESWHKLYLDRSLRILGRRENLPAGLRLGQGESFLDELADEDRQRFLRELGECGEEQSTSGIFAARDGTPLEILIANRGDGFDIFLRDIANRMRSLEQLAIFYRHFLTTPIGICITTPHGEIVDANRAFLDFYGFTLPEVLHKNPRILKSGRQSPAAYRSLWEAILDPRVGHWSGELINRRRNGSEVTVRLTVSAVRKSDGSLLGFIANTLDVTEQKRLEEELRAYNRELSDLNRLKSELVAITSHDLKSPLNSIISRVRLIQEELDELSPDELRGHLDGVVEAAGKLTSFIGELLDLEKIESGNFRLTTQRLRLDAVLRSCIETNAPHARERGITLQLIRDGAMEPHRADIVKLEQVFNNLIGNAIKFSPEHSTIDIVLRDAGPGQEKTIAVSDRGPGIPEEELAKIFDRYYQVKREGAVPKRVFGVGLGLSIVKNIVDLHGGRVSARRRDGGGSEFTVAFPHRGAITTGKDLAALAVDPGETILRYLETPLAGRGITLFRAATPAEVEKLIGWEQPELIFVASDHLPPELATAVSRHGGRTRERVVVELGATRNTLLDGTRHLTLPLLDVELYELLDDLLLNFRTEHGS